MKKRGKIQKIAMFALGYGSSIPLASKKSGLGLRRTKTLAKHIAENGFRIRD
ncbi:hypothetical protein KNV09_gp092 [Vibrio phage Athena]|uniref:Uncharacterized protein n=12 Tax=Thalassavirus TaxID=2948922 RepID=A0A6M4ETB7_9CAUD|nr:hypothetical protein FDJ20_gp096 [Vibrio phage Thalassa]YP_010101868.1 hypothetical protein KNU52_gp089 [Vibrio phage Achelous]YP_010102523.1 hypothetical protein KNU58_gp083 [Vibrio phage Brizo]YP_010102711.1 hypothetical protein KNU59_gp090 [Vibrio phage Pontus]YP_010105685.1 hypothetical protein KNU87_gp092 [Vibrio phage Bennett]YP_010105880.1 hypothetical protein KNU88_gp094 [Vibrio phage Chester]YP_010107943.1 hypothetical protein KNV05_gp095 [Vibrio phage River4]YP_010108137.1 hypot